MKVAANISLMFQQQPLLERISVAQAQGFSGIEVQFPYTASPSAWKTALQEANLPCVLFNLPAADFMQGGPGLSCHPERTQTFIEALELSLPYIDALQPLTLNVLAGRQVEGYSRQACWQQLVHNLQHTCDLLAERPIKITCEPINNLDQPGYLTPSVSDWQSLAKQVERTNFALQLDFYHAFRMKTDIASTVEENIKQLAHIQFADCPGRSHPGSGQLDWDLLLNHLKKADYQGWLGAEFVAQQQDDFSWLKLSSWQT